MEDMSNAPVLNSESWLNVIDNTEQGEEIPAPLGLLPFRKGVLTALGAETEVGKTAFGLQAFRTVVDCGYKAVYCTLEMSPALLFKRFYPQFGSEENCRDWIEEKDAHVSHSYLDYQEVEQIIRKGYDFVVLDHIHELPYDGHEDLARKVKRIASLAPETNTSILMLAQLKQPDPLFPRPPEKYDFSNTKAIIEVAGTAWGLWRPDKDERDQVECITLKNRFGPIQDPVEMTLTRDIIFERNSLW